MLEPPNIWDAVNACCLYHNIPADGGLADKFRIRCLDRLLEPS